MANAWDFGTNTAAGIWGDNQAARNAAWAAVGLDPSGRYPGADVGKRGIVDLMPLMGQQFGFAKGLEPIREQMINNWITKNNPNNSNYLVDAARRNALSQGLQSQNQLAVNGYGGGFTDLGSVMSQANQAGSDAYNMVNSPDFQNAQYGGVLGAISQGQDVSGIINAMSSLHGLTTSTPRNASGLQSIGQVLGQASSMFGGGGLGQLLGQARGSASGSSSNPFSFLSGGGGSGGGGLGYLTPTPGAYNPFAGSGGSFSTLGYGN